ncbi:hypothetical protein VTP01DRAFT_7780 [Rhizomucor pusillus]|uniref:uncharacterized protein n=1 Tax=Rhizomucor pusillus TaxID=4840 RepID=UPI003742F0B0
MPLALRTLFQLIDRLKFFLSNLPSRKSPVILITSSVVYWIIKRFVPASLLIEVETPMSIMATESCSCSAEHVANKANLANKMIRVQLKP